jgi:uncharacterized iron-regulated protein
MKFILLLISLSISLSGMAQHKPAYRIYTAEGKAVGYGKMMKKIFDAEVILFGELHNNSLCHWLELQVVKDLFEKQSDMAIGMEMFEADNQLILDEYLQGIIEEKHLQAEAKVWDNYETDYRPLVEFAREHQLKVIASNIPRRYANLVYRKGIATLDSLPDTAKQWIAPLPIEVDLSLPGYKDMMEMMGGHGEGNETENLAKSQAVKDATMAYFVIEALKEGVVLHFNGTYHSQNREGIVWYLQQANPTLKIATLHTVEQEDIETLEEEHKNAADFIICIPDDMTKTY